MKVGSNLNFPVMLQVKLPVTFFTHKVTNLLWVWRIRLQVTKNLGAPLIAVKFLSKQSPETKPQQFYNAIFLNWLL